MDMEIETPTSESSLAEKLKDNEEAMTKDLGNSTSLGGSTSASLNSENANGSNSDLSCHDEENDGEDGVEDGCDISDYDDNDDYMYDDDVDDDDVDDDDDYLLLQAQFDNVDLPPGVEASVSWLQESTSSSNVSTSSIVSSQVNPTDLSAVVGGSAAVLPDVVTGNTESVASSSSLVSAGLSSNGKGKEENGDEVMRKYELFKHFDVVDDFSDHHYSSMGFNGQQPPGAWTRKIQDEWKILEKDLPDMIYVRAYETRMELLRAVIIGPQGTPYHDGLFVFDVFFPTNYPNEPPMVYYYSGGLRLNPNLYDCGKVCLSLLNTWTGHANEKWMPQTSTMLQVLVSIQALILNARPFFNEPGYERTYVGAEGERKSNAYNDDVFILSLKTMMYTLRRPPKHFEDLVVGHFRAHAHDILSACRAYMGGAPVGSMVKGKLQDGAANSGSHSAGFQSAVGRLINGLIANFTKNGAKECEQFRVTC